MPSRPKSAAAAAGRMGKPSALAAGSSSSPASRYAAPGTWPARYPIRPIAPPRTSTIRTSGPSMRSRDVVGLGQKVGVRVPPGRAARLGSGATTLVTATTNSSQAERRAARHRASGIGRRRVAAARGRILHFDGRPARREAGPASRRRRKIGWPLRSRAPTEKETPREHPALATRTRPPHPDDPRPDRGPLAGHPGDGAAGDDPVRAAVRRGDPRARVPGPPPGVPDLRRGHRAARFGTHRARGRRPLPGRVRRPRRRGGGGRVRQPHEGGHGARRRRGDGLRRRSWVGRSTSRGWSGRSPRFGRRS